jgi:hypothetical protein
VVHIALTDEDAIDLLRWLEEREMDQRDGTLFRLRDQLERLTIAKAKGKQNGSQCVSETSSNVGDLSR